MKIEKLYYRLAFLFIALAIVLVGYGALYFPFAHPSLTDAQISSASGTMLAAAIILLAAAWALVEIAGRDPRANTDTILLLRSLRHSLMHPFTDYWIRKRYHWAAAHLRDLSVRLRGNRFLSVAKDDSHCTLYWVGHERGQKPVDAVFEAIVPNRPGVWGRGWLHAKILNEEGHAYLLDGSDGEVATHYFRGQVKWERPDSADS